MATERGRDGDQKSFGHLGRWPVLADEQVQSNTPTQADGFTAAKEFTLRKKAARVVFDTAKAQGVTAGTSTVAVTMFLRFFCRRSMEKNHPFVVALASLFLACKVNDNPRSLRGLQVEMLKQWYGRDSPELRERLNEKRTMDRLRETAIRAEALLLMTLGFDLNIDVLLTSFVNLMNEVPELRGFKTPNYSRSWSTCAMISCRTTARSCWCTPTRSLRWPSVIFSAIDGQRTNRSRSHQITQTDRVGSSGSGSRSMRWPSSATGWPRCTRR